jgi:GntR family transcriptional regulator
MKTNEPPIFRKIIDRINAGIESGEFARGDAIPSEPELCKQFSTTRMTVRRAIDALVNEGKLFRVQGKGTFVSQLDLDKTYQKQGFSSNMRSLGVHPSSYVLLADQCEGNAEVRQSLEMLPDEPIFCLQRIRMADESPIAIERVWISLRRFPRLPEFDFSKRSLYEVLHEEFGLDLTSSYSRQRIKRPFDWRKGRGVALSNQARRRAAHSQRGLRQSASPVCHGGYALSRWKIHTGCCHLTKYTPHTARQPPN